MGGEPGGTSASIHGLGYLFSALRREGLIADEPVLQLTTFLRSLDLFLELIVLTPGTLTANQVRHGGKQGTDNPELSRIHSSACPVLTSLPRSLRSAVTYPTVMIPAFGVPSSILLHFLSLRQLYRPVKPRA